MKKYRPPLQRRIFAEIWRNAFRLRILFPLPWTCLRFRGLFLDAFPWTHAACYAACHSNEVVWIAKFRHNWHWDWIARNVACHFIMLFLPSFSPILSSCLVAWGMSAHHTFFCLNALFPLHANTQCLMSAFCTRYWWIQPFASLFQNNLP